MLGAGVNRSFALVTAPLRLTLSHPCCIILAIRCVTARVWENIEVHHSSKFSLQGRGHILQMLGPFRMENEGFEKASGILVSIFFLFSQCGGGGDRWIDRENCTA